MHNKKRVRTTSFFLTAPFLTFVALFLAMSLLFFISVESISKPDTILPSLPSAAGKKRILPELAINATSPHLPSAHATTRLEKTISDLQTFTFEEDTAESIEEKVTHADYAIIQAGKSLQLPASSVRIQAKAKKEIKGQQYPIHSVAILPGANSKKFISTLKEWLSLWSEGATLVALGKNNYAIEFNEIRTHLISVYPRASSFPQSIAPKTFSEKLHRRPNQPAFMVIIIDDLGESNIALTRLLALHYPVTLAFWPYGSGTKEGAEKAHKAGREILVHMPMEAVSNVDPGPGALYTSLSSGETKKRILQGIARVPYATGMNNHMGSKLTKNKEKVDIVLTMLQDNHFFVVDSVTHPQSVLYQEARKFPIRRFQRSVFLDNKKSKFFTLRQLQKAQNIALLTGEAIAIGHPYPSTLDALEAWQRDPDITVVKLSDFPSH